jgi:hypothetical protein
METSIPDQIADGRTDLIFDYLAQGHPVDSVWIRPEYAGMEANLLGKPHA